MTGSDSPITGYVAKILNTHQLVANIGASSGVKKNMLFDVVYPTLGIVDPKTKEPLGELTMVKKRLKATMVDDRFSVMTTLSKRVKRGGGSLMTLSQMYDVPRWETEHDSLEEADSDRRPLREIDSLVKVGDPVYQVARRRTEESREDAHSDESDSLQAEVSAAS